MIILGIETSTSVCSVGLADEKGLCGEISLVESRIHSEKILTLINTLCEKNKIELSDLGGIAISVGPGSFTGLRIGMSTAKGLSFSLSKPLLTVPTFEAVAISCFHLHAEETKVVILVDAKQGQYYKAMYEKRDGSVITISSPKIESIFPLEELNYKESIVITDSIQILKKYGQQYKHIDEITNYCRGDFIAKIGFYKLKAGEISNLENTEPLYLKDFIVKSNEAAPAKVD